MTSNFSKMHKILLKMKVLDPILQTDTNKLFFLSPSFSRFLSQGLLIRKIIFLFQSFSCSFVLFVEKQVFIDESNFFEVERFDENS